MSNIHRGILVMSYAAIHAAPAVISPSAPATVRFRVGDRKRTVVPRKTQLTARFTSAAIFFSSVAVSDFSANAVGHIAPSSSLAESLKPKVA